MKQSTASIDKIAQVFNLTEGEKFLLLECEVGEGLFFAGLNHVAIKVIASYTEDQLITTDPQQLLELQGTMGGTQEKEETIAPYEATGTSPSTPEVESPAAPPEINVPTAPPPVAAPAPTPPAQPVPKAPPEPTIEIQSPPEITTVTTPSKPPAPLQMPQV